MESTNSGAKTAPTLQNLRGLCYRAHAGTSFSPDRRADSYVKDYSEMLDADLALLGDKQGNYKEKFIEKFSAWMNAKSKCVSSMIAGPSNFPVRRAMKANDSERRHYDDFIAWRERYFQAVNRVPTKSPEEELEIAEKRLEDLVLFQMECKEINAEIRKRKLSGFSEIANDLLKDGFSPEKIKLVELRAGRYAIPSFYLTNNNATIKRTKEKIQIMQTRIERKTDWEDITFEGGYVTIEDDRVKVFHDEKPSQEVIQEIKSNGFRWSPFWKCWCRKHTGNAVYVAKNLSFVKNQ